MGLLLFCRDTRTVNYDFISELSILWITILLCVSKAIVCSNFTNLRTVTNLLLLF